MTDLQRALRNWRRAPGFTAVAILTLGLAIGLATTMFSLVSAIVFPPSEFPHPDRLVTLSETSETELCAGCGVGTSRPTLSDWRRATRSYATMAAYVEEPMVVSAPLVPQRMAAARVGPELFATLGLPVTLGRDFTAADAAPGASPVVIIGDGLWRDRLGGTPAVVGTTLRINGVPQTVIGVAPPGLKFPEVAEFWVPLPPDGSEGPGARRDDRGIGVVARLAPGVSVSDAGAELRVVAAQLAAAHPEQRQWSAVVQTLGDDRADETGTAFLVLLGAVGFVLAIACANLGALILARVSRTYRELAVRAALGATRGRLVRHMLADSVLTGVVAGALGVGVAMVGVRVAAAGIETPVPYYVHFGIDWRVLVFASVAAVACGVLAGLPPALAASRPHVTTGLRLGGSAGVGTDRRQRRWQRILLVTELALVLVLLAGAALMGKTLARFRQPPAFPLEGLVMADVPWGGARYESAAAVAQAAASLEASLTSEPGWQAGFQHLEFLRGFGATARPARTDAGDIAAGRAPRFGFAVTPGLFAAQGVPVIAGRGFDERDRAGAEPVVIVNRSFADGVWPGADPVGRRVQLPVEGEADVWRRVIGVVADVDTVSGPARRPNPYAYFSYAQLPRRPLELLVRADAPAERVGQALQAMVARIDPDEPVVNARSAVADRRRQYWEIGFLAALYSVFAAFGVVVAAVGLYGVVSQMVGERMREFGVRLALGASPRHLAALVLASTGTLAVAGALIGLGAAALSTRALGAMLYGTNPLDPAVLASVAAGLGLVTVAASLIPARRAARIDPLKVLRED